MCVWGGGGGGRENELHSVNYWNGSSHSDIQKPWTYDLQMVGTVKLTLQCYSRLLELYSECSIGGP